MLKDPFVKYATLIAYSIILIISELYFYQTLNYENNQFKLLTIVSIICLLVSAILCSFILIISEKRILSIALFLHGLFILFYTVTIYSILIDIPKILRHYSSGGFFPGPGVTVAIGSMFIIIFLIPGFSLLSIIYYSFTITLASKQ